MHKNFIILSIFITALGNFCFASGDLEQGLRQKLDTPNMLNSADDDIKTLAQFYQQRDFKPLWFDRDRPIQAVALVLDVFQRSDQEGLDPTDYEQARILMQEAQKDQAKMIDAEVMMTAMVLEYIDDIGGERLNPRRIDRALHLKEKNIDEAQVLRDGMSKDPSGQWLARLTIHHPEYQFLKKTLANYRARQGIENYPLLPAGKSLRKGDEAEAVKILQAQLSALDLLKGHFTIGTIDEPTEKAIIQFQTDNHLQADGIVGPQTRETLNAFNLEQRIHQIIVSMERWRWVPEDRGQRYVQVNIAAFDLKAVENGETKLYMPVIIGRAYRHTPVFNSTIYSIRFNPSWHVPRSIAVRDKLRHIKKDPGYLERGHYVLYDASGQRINPHSVNWGAVNASNFNYRLRQTPGNHNALGKIRFTIKSPFNIYLHSTDATHLFDKPVRSLSSGCIRVSKPAELAQFVFNNPSDWPLDRINTIMQGVQTQDIDVNPAVPVYITYFTVWQGKDGYAHFGRDIYGQDEKIWQALQNRARRKV